MFEINAPRSSLESNRLDPNLSLARAVGIHEHDALPLAENLCEASFGEVVTYQGPCSGV